MNHRRREQEQPEENTQGSAICLSPTVDPSSRLLNWPPCACSAVTSLPGSDTTAPCCQNLGFCRDKAKKLDAKISPQRSLMAGGAKTDQTRVSVCTVLVSPGLGAGLSLDFAPPLTQWSWELGKHVTAKKCNWPQARCWGVGGRSRHLGLQGNLRKSWPPDRSCPSLLTCHPRPWAPPVWAYLGV